MYQVELKRQIKQDCWEECKVKIDKVRELRHKLVLDRQINKFNKLLEEKLQENNYRERLNYQSGHTNSHSNEKEQIMHDTNNKWVVNLSSVPLTQEQISLSEHGPNFAVTAQRPPYGEYIKAIETACQSLDPNSVEERRSEVYRVLRHPHQLKTNLRKEEFTAIKQLKADKRGLY